MNFVSVLSLGAFLCVALVSAAPSTQSLSILELKTSPAFTNAYEKLMVYGENRECIHRVLDNAFGKTDMAALWNSFFFKVDQMMNDWQRAQTIGDKSEELKYKSILLANGLNVMSFEVPALISESKWEMLKVVRSTISTECLGKPESFNLLADADYLALWKSVSDFAAHIIDVLGNLSANASLWSWSEYRTQLQQQYEKLNECTNASELDVDICSIKEGIAFFKLAADFNRMAFNDPQVLSLFTESA